MFEDHLNNFWVIKSKEYCRKKKLPKLVGFFFMGFLVLKDKLFICLYMNVL